DKLYLAESQTGYVTQERKNWNSFDYADFQYTATVVSSSGLNVTLTSTANIQVGDSLYQIDSLGNLVGQSIITGVTSSTVITVTDLIPWIAGTATVYQPITVSFKYTPIG